MRTRIGVGAGASKYTHVMHGGGRMTIDPRIPICNAGTADIAFSTTRQTLLAPSTKRRKVFGESHSG